MVEVMDVDVAIAGGGLAGALIAWRLRQTRPDLRIALVEQEDHLGGRHTWSFHGSDVSPEQLAWLRPLIVHQWSRQEVRFPGYQRFIDTPYCSINAERLHEVVAPALGSSVLLKAPIATVDQHGLQLKDQRRVTAKAVIDARGPRSSDALSIGFQKFIGQTIRFKAPHGLDGPIIMDATVPQIDGYRFVYVLPFSDDEALVEDTYYADGAELPHDDIRVRIEEYCNTQGWAIDKVLYEEDGVLPIALAGDINAHLASGIPGVAQVGLGAGLFHPLTGYSLPNAVALADQIATSFDLPGVDLAGLTIEAAEAHWRSSGYYRLLARFLFHAAAPAERYKVLSRFYRMPTPLIERFYAGRSTAADKMRILSGKPPVNLLRALECLPERDWRRKHWRTDESR